MKEAVIASLFVILSLWVMFQVEPSFKQDLGKGVPFPNMTPIPEASKVLVIPSGNLMFNAPDGIFIKRFYKKDLDWDVLGTLR